MNALVSLTGRTMDVVLFRGTKDDLIAACANADTYSGSGKADTITVTAIIGLGKEKGGVGGEESPDLRGAQGIERAGSPHGKCESTCCTECGIIVLLVAPTRSCCRPLLVWTRISTYTSPSRGGRTVGANSCAAPASSTSARAPQGRAGRRWTRKSRYATIPSRSG